MTGFGLGWQRIVTNNTEHVVRSRQLHWVADRPHNSRTCSSSCNHQQHAAHGISVPANSRRAHLTGVLPKSPALLKADRIGCREHHAGSQAV